MKVVNFADTYQIYKDDLKTYDKLPAFTYKIAFSKLQGFSLVRVDSFVNREEKIYGNHEQKVKKMIRSYDLTNRSLGVILSGDKGMGKSLFVNLLGEAMIKKDIPVIICQDNYAGVSDFIESIKQDALFIFDEYEKNFPIAGDGETQQKMLSLFDGLSQTKRMYAITVNKLRDLSDFILNRTGRFHYHLRFDYPTLEELRIYMEDKVKPEYHSEIKYVSEFSARVKLNYDTLRSIAFELNLGNGFKESISDMNIIQEGGNRYEFYVKFAGSKEEVLVSSHMNSFDNDKELAVAVPKIEGVPGRFIIELLFDPTKAKYENNGFMKVGPEFIESEAYYDLDEDMLKKIKVEYIKYKLERTSGVHYEL